ncbi:hypothetical protein A1O1_02229 [Capronia coronata CBS 617.96]|uniref:DNA topoisomerase (ATP-hydrolyzing) n=1 Tax=Capronia coronata CBS 617.96 TaxID=1182541 RepID=W9YX63_9EURO|nr:uncharacterized protein A1O1_02229 [Capronia coronata CBS 617.96]EXJ93836.1 hypothetical protein A1O1_02229 [Capronia coronata CBS 617.96]
MQRQPCHERRTSTAERPAVSAENQRVLNYIENSFNSILREIRLRPPGKPVLVLKRIVAVKPYYDNDDLQRVKCDIESREVRYHFPGKNEDEAWRFTCVGRILGEIHTAIRQGITVTKSRDIYYHDPALFKQQETVDRYLDDIAYTCRVTRRDLNVSASPKGLIAGLQPTLPGQREAIHIPDDRTTLPGISHIRWILVIEKEATFRSLVEMGLHQHSKFEPGLLVTAKGYPDVATRYFLRFVLDHAHPPIPIFGLFDWDPDGIQILKCYLYGSKNLAQEHASIIPEMVWIGLKAEDIHASGPAHGVLLPLSMRDRALAVSMLGSAEWRDGEGEVLSGLQECTAQLQRMLKLGRKAEIQILDHGEGGLERWLITKLRDGVEHLSV